LKILESGSLNLPNIILQMWDCFAICLGLKINRKEIDILFQDGRDLVAIEIKAASIFNQALLKNIQLIKDTIKIKKY